MSQLTQCNILGFDPAQRIANSILEDHPVTLFSGQGSQMAGMGKDLAEASPEAMNYWKDAEKISGLPLREIYWEGSDEDMSDTRSLQPALTVVNYNLWNAIAPRLDVQPSACAGHSLGEFSALACAGAISPKSALEITSLRGRLMAEADPEGKGAMAAIVKLEQPDVQAIVNEAAGETGELVIAANYNTPLQTVVSGAKNAVAAACAKARALKGKSVPLKVSGAFHSPMMEEANRELAPLLEKTEWHDPAFPVYSNVDAQPATTGEQAKKSILRQMISPVYWLNVIRNLYLAGARWWMEISPRAVLGKMIGPSLAGIIGQCESLRVDLINSLSSVLHYSL